MTGAEYTPQAALEVAANAIIHTACTMDPVCGVIEFVFQDETGASCIVRRLLGPRHAVLGMSLDPDSLLDIEKLQDVFFPIESDVGGSNSDGVDSDDGDEGEAGSE